MILGLNCLFIFIDKVSQISTLSETNKSINFFSVFNKNDSWHSTDFVMHCNFIKFVNIDFQQINIFMSSNFFLDKWTFLRVQNKPIQNKLAQNEHIREVYVLPMLFGAIYKFTQNKRKGSGNWAMKMNTCLTSCMDRTIQRESRWQDLVIRRGWLWMHRSLPNPLLFHSNYESQRFVFWPYWLPLKCQF